MKKLLTLTLSTLLVLTLLVSCSADKENTTAATENTSVTNGTETTILQETESTTYDDKLPTNPDTPATQTPATQTPATQTPATQTPASTTITSDEAKAIALGHAGLAESEVSRYHSELDRERGGLVYEIEFDSATHEYEYEVNAETGEIIKSEKEYKD